MLRAPAGRPPPHSALALAFASPEDAFIRDAGDASFSVGEAAKLTRANARGFLGTRGRDPLSGAALRALVEERSSLSKCPVSGGGKRSLFSLPQLQ